MATMELQPLWFALFLLTLGQSAWVLQQYSKRKNKALFHNLVLLLGLSFLAEWIYLKMLLWIILNLFALNLWADQFAEFGGSWKSSSLVLIDSPLLAVLFTACFLAISDLWWRVGIVALFVIVNALFLWRHHTTKPSKH